MTKPQVYFNIMSRVLSVSMHEVMFTMSIYSYKVFYEVAEQGSFARAAENLHITSSAVSHTIARLEEQMGFPLFIRDRRGIVITNEGRQVLENVKDIIMCDNRLMQESAQIVGLSKGSVRIGAYSSVTVEWLPDIIASYHERYPGIRVTVEQGGYSNVIELMRRGAVDIGFLSENVPVDESYSIMPIYKDPMVCIAPPGMFRKNKKNVTMDELRDRTFILQSPGFDADVRALMREYEVDPKHEFIIRSDIAMVALVSKGIGVAIAPELSVRAFSDRVRVLRIKPEVCRTVELAVPQREFMTPAAHAMVGQILAYIDENGLNNIEEGKRQWRYR